MGFARPKRNGITCPAVGRAGLRRGGFGGPALFMKTTSPIPSRAGGRRQVSRREFLKVTATAAASVGAAQWLPRRAAAAPRNKELPKPNKSNVEHVVVLMMENRSFDHLLGWLPNAAARQGGLVYYDRNNVAFPTMPLAPDYQGCGHPDPDHSYAG